LEISLQVVVLLEEASAGAAADLEVSAAVLSVVAERAEAGKFSFPF
jgi:hypothetical protein